MSGRLLEATTVPMPVDGNPAGRMYAPYRDAQRRDVRVYTGKAVTMLAPEDLHLMAKGIHEKFGEGKARGHMHQPSLDTIVEGMEQGDYTLSVNHVPDVGPLVIATAHVRRAKSAEDRRELGGVVKVEDPLGVGRGQGLVVSSEGVWLATKVQGATGVEALVAEKNEAGQSFFRGIGREIGKRPSDYVEDPETGRAAEMVIFDVTRLKDPQAA